MKYAPSIAALTFLTLLLDPVASIPVPDNLPPYMHRTTLPATLPHAVGLESRSQSDKRDKSYGFGDPTHFAVLVDPVSRPNPCGVSGCTKTLKPRDLNEEEELVARAVRKRSLEDGEFITNVSFSPE
jgi:hypothetical protein